MRVCRAWVVLVVLVLAACGPGETGAAVVVSVADGDTLVVEHDGAEVRVRLWGVDCPERGQPFSGRARRYTSDAVLGKAVRLEVRDRDQYGRTVAMVYTSDGRDLNAELIREGLAWWYRRYAPERTDYEALERDARKARRGLWRDARPVPPWEWRHRRNRPGT